jgi:hypothetical protein
MLAMMVAQGIVMKKVAFIDAAWMVCFDAICVVCSSLHLKIQLVITALFNSKTLIVLL